MLRNSSRWTLLALDTETGEERFRFPYYSEGKDRVANFFGNPVRAGGTASQKGPHNQHCLVEALSSLSIPPFPTFPPFIPLPVLRGRGGRGPRHLGHGVNRWSYLPDTHRPHFPSAFSSFRGSIVGLRPARVRCPRA